LLNVEKSAADKYPACDVLACATCIVVPVLTTALDPPVIVRIDDPVSVKFPFVSAESLLLNVEKSSADK
jgi:hypothetical protein